MQAPDRSQHEVVIAGGGPTGLMLGAELALAGVDVAIVERRASQELVGSRAGGLHARTIEIFDQRGVADRFLSAGQTAQVAGFAHIPLDLGDFPTRHPYGLGLWQNETERLLAEWVAELGLRVQYGREVTGFAQDETGVSVRLADGHDLRASYLVGCDGGRSLVRKTAGVEFPGWDPTVSCLIAEAEVDEVPELGVRRDEKGVHAFGRLKYEIRDGEVVFDDEGPVSVMVTEQRVSTGGEPTLGDLRAALEAVYGTDFGIHSPTWISRFTDVTRQAASYRAGRVLLAGDAAHVHSPAGGQGLNIGVQDAVNLGWKLGRVVKGRSTDQLLDSYHDERHPVAARVLRMTMAQMPLIGATNDRIRALHETIAEMFSMEEPRKRFAGMMSGLDIRYDLGGRHPLVGRRMPDLEIRTADGPLRVYSLLHEARPVLLDLGESDAFDVSRWERVRFVRASYHDGWELPVVGEVEAPAAVLIRPDGHVAWAGDPADAGLPDALTKWF